jgi:hypothetical protein
MRVQLAVLLLFAASDLLMGQKVPDENDPVKHPTMTNKTFVTKLGRRPIDFYLSHKAIDSNAKMFYRGEYALYDDDGTFAFLDSLLTRNSETKPFYLFIYNQAMKITDGALAEYMASICRRYFEKYPCEFMANLSENVSEAERSNWIGMVGFDLYDRETFQKAIIEADKKVNANCPSRKPEWAKVKPGIESNLEDK